MILKQKSNLTTSEIIPRCPLWKAADWDPALWKQRRAGIKTRTVQGGHGRIISFDKWKGTGMIWVVYKRNGKELIVHINKALAEEGLKSGLYLRKATKYDLSTLLE